MENNESVTLIVSCKLLNLTTGTVFADPVEYTLGEPGFNRSFHFEQEIVPTDCTLPMVYTLTDVPGRPSTLTLNSDATQLEMAESSDQTQIGIYNNLVLKASVENTAFTASITFNVRINPCPITSFTTDGLEQNIIYSIGENSITSNPYGTAT